MFNQQKIEVAGVGKSLLLKLWFHIMGNQLFVSHKEIERTKNILLDCTKYHILYEYSWELSYKSLV